RNLTAVAIEIALARTPAGCVPLSHNAMNPIGREKSIFDALAQTIRVNRIAEVAVSIAIVFPQRCRSHAQLKSRLEVTQNLAPIAVVFGAAPMALIDDDQIEKILRIFFIKSRPVFIFGDRLIDREIELTAFVDFAVLDLPSSIAEGRKHLVLGIVDQ